MAKDLSSLLDTSEVIDRARLRSYLDKERLPAKVLDSVDALRWIGKELGATTILRGTTANQDGKLRLTAQLLASDGKKPSRREEFTAPDDGNLSAALAPIDNYSSFETLLAGFLVAGKDGVTAPTCIYCPPPSFSSAARAAKFQGTVLLAALVNEEGHVSSAIPLRGLPFGLTENAIAVIRNWRLRPATKEGHSVSAMTPIEVSFHLY